MSILLSVVLALNLAIVAAMHFKPLRLGLSVRRASQRCNVARGTAQRALVELQDRGFVDCMTKGAFSRKAVAVSNQSQRAA